MNQFYYETRGKEKIRELQAEGMRSQAYHRSGGPRTGFFQGLQKLLKAIQGRANDKKVEHAETRYAQPEVE